METTMITIALVAMTVAGFAFCLWMSRYEHMDVR